MKKPFNTEGVDDFQRELLHAAEDFRQLQIQRIRYDFKNFVCDSFDFSESQLQQISNMTAKSATELGTAIADSWVLGRPINFQKDSPLTQKDTKDIILSGTNSTLAGPVLIWIRYSSSQANCCHSEPDQLPDGNSQKFRLT